MQKQSAEQTLQDISRRRPALSSLLTAFSPILQKQDELGERYTSELSSVVLKTDTERMQQGVPLFADTDVPDCSSQFATCAQELIGPLSGIPLLKDKAEQLASLFANLSHEDQKHIVEAVSSNNPTLIDSFAEEKNVAPLETTLYGTFVVQVILRALVQNSFGSLSEMPWDTNNIWQQGYCPVCGSYPTIAWFDRAKVDERNTYLLPGGSRKHLHCGVCGADWRFLRLSCPMCGISKSKQIEILSEENDKFGEALDWCSQCESYCPTIDIRDRIAMPHLEAQAIGMLHLELIAFEKKLHPLRSSFWNTFI